MKLTLRVDQGDGPLEVSTNLFTIVAWERKFKTKASKISDGIGMEDLAFMAHQALQQNNVIVPVVLDDFIRKLVLLEVIDTETDTPFDEAPTATL